MFAAIVRACARVVFRLVFRLKLVGGENIPATGGAILAGNHVSYADPAFLWTFSPRWIHFMAKSELFHGFLGWLLVKFFAFPVSRGTADRAAISAATGYLEAGELVGMFPEGTRQAGEGPGEAHGGVAFIAMRAGVPVVPVAFAGTERVLPRGQKLPRFVKVVIKVGEPIDPASFTDGSRKERVEALTAEIMRRIASELEEAKGL